MLGNPYLDRVRESFAEQFEPDGSGFLYRESMRGAAIPVTRAERDGFVAAFNRRLRYAAWAMVPTTFVPLILMIVLLPGPDDDIVSVVIGGSLGVGILLFLVVHRWAYKAPIRELGARPTATAPRSREDMRRRMFAKMSYGQLSFAAVGGPLLVWKVSLQYDVWRGWGLLWPAFAAMIVVTAIIMALCKWRFERKE